MNDRYRVTEIFYSLQGETRTVGWPTVFIRLTGCPLRCEYCDTEYAFNGGEMFSREDILGEVRKYSARYITVTGGEPLAQVATPRLLQDLCDAGYRVSLETSGCCDIDGIDKRVSVVMDIKTPSSGESEKNLYTNIKHLRDEDQVKFVIRDHADYEWSRDKMAEYTLDEKCEVLFSPVHNVLSPELLAQWILDDQLFVRMQHPLHKQIWGDERGR